MSAETSREISFCKRTDGFFEISWYDENAQLCSNIFDSSERAGDTLFSLLAVECG